MQEKIKIAIIGCGKMGGNHVRVLSLLNKADIQFLHDPDETRINSLCKTYNINFDNSLSLKEKLQKYKLDAVVISTSTATHADIFDQIINYVKFIFIEKPLSEDFSVSSDICKKANEKGVKIQVGFIERYNPAIIELNKILGDGQSILNIDLTRTNKLSSRIKDVDVVMDLMIHDIDIALLLNGPTKSITAYGILVDGFIAFARATLHHQNGRFSSITASRITEIRLRTINVTCKDMYIDCNLIRKEILINKQSISSPLKNVTLESIAQTVLVPTQEALLSEQIDFLKLCSGEETLPTIPTVDNCLSTHEVAKKIQDIILSEHDKNR